jgi:hypothetical protein
MKRITLEQWITEACQDADKGKDCSLLQLVYLKPGGVGHEDVHSKVIQGPQDFKSLGMFFTGKACVFAQDLPGMQSFKLLAYYGEQEPKASHTFTVFEGNVTAGDKAPWSKHEPTAQGMQAQLMKHNETLMGQCVQLVQGLTAALLQRDMAHQQEKAEMTVILRDVILNMKKEDREAKLEQLKFQRESEERAMVARLLPSMVNYATGRELVPENLADTQIIEALALRIKPEQLQMLQASGLVTPEQLLLLTARFKKIRDEHEAKQKAFATAPPEDSGPVKELANAAE